MLLTVTMLASGDEAEAFVASKAVGVLNQLIESISEAEKPVIAAENPGDRVSPGGTTRVRISRPYYDPPPILSAPLPLPRGLFVACPPPSSVHFGITLDPYTKSGLQLYPPLPPRTCACYLALPHRVGPPRWWFAYLAHLAAADGDRAHFRGQRALCQAPPDWGCRRARHAAYVDFDMICGVHVPRISPQFTIPHAPRDTLYYVIVFGPARTDFLSATPRAPCDVLLSAKGALCCSSGTLG